MRRAVTLLELLVVIMIVMMVTAAAIPMMLPALQNRKMREAARLASSYISGARARAIATGRDVGVMIERFNGNPFATQLAYVDVPPPYAGDSAQSVCTVIPGPNLTLSMQYGFNPALVQVNDEIQLNLQGPRYRIIAVSGSKLTVVHPAPTPVTRIPWNLASPPVPYQIFRQPIRSSVAPLQLPEGIVVDLMQSGVGAAGTFVVNAGIPPSQWLTTTTPPVPFNPVITFTPSGAVGYLGTLTLARPTGPIYLLMGRRELMADASVIKGTPTPEDKNLYDSDPKPANLYLQNYWLAIGYQTGLVTVAECAVNANNLGVARTFARTSQGIGGQ